MALTEYNCLVIEMVAEDLVVYWPADMNTINPPTLPDISGNGHTGAVGGSSQMVNGLIFGSGTFDAITFAGASGDVTATTLSATFPAFTVVTWFSKVANFFFTNTDIWRGNAGSTAFVRVDGGSAPRPFRAQWPGGGVLGNVTVPGARSAGEIFMLGVTYDGKNGRLFVNGAEDGSGSGSGSLTIAGDMRFHRPDNTQDEMFFASRALSTLEMAQLYECGSAGTDCFSCTPSTPEWQIGVVGFVPGGGGTVAPRVLYPATDLYPSTDLYPNV